MSTISQPAVGKPAKPASPAEDSVANLTDAAATLPWLPCTVTLEIPLRRFTVADLSRLSVGSVVATACPRNGDVPLYVNGQLIGWAELEVIDDRLAVRIMEIA